MTIDANAIFEEELSRRGVSFVKESEHEYRVEIGGLNVTANLANIRRNAERDQDPDAVRRFVDKVLAAVPSDTPDWSVAREFLLFSAEPADQDFGDSIRSRVTDEVSRVLTLTDHGQTGIAWVTPQMCAKWGVTVEHAESTAAANQERLLEGIQIELAEADGKALGMVPLASPYKASVIFARAFRAFVEGAFGWPVLVVVPCRDFIYVVADDSPLLEKMGSVVVNEYRNSGYPITTEVLRVSDAGIEAIGRYPA